MIAERFLRDPAILDFAKANLARCGKLRVELPALREWADLIESGDTLAIVSALIRVDEEGMRMRLTSPFAEILTYEERSLIFESNGSKASLRDVTE
jgi:hypothetical protein